jgi:4'-phosphopantetheinyl transferase EntD
MDEDRRLADLVPPTVRMIVLSGAAAAEPLLPGEEAAVARAVEKRKREFALGRTAARRAMGELGVPPSPLLRNSDGSVAWPPSVWGSITHADGICIAAAARREDHGGIGIDVEVRKRVRRELWSRITTAAEQAWLQTATDETMARDRATLLFSAKEAFFKAQFCRTRAWVGFLDAEVQISADGRFNLELLVDVNALTHGERFEGRFAFTDEHVAAAVVLPP